MMLPALEQSSLFNAANFTTGFSIPSNPQNTTVFDTKLSFPPCPSDIDRLTKGAGHANYPKYAGSEAYTIKYGDDFRGVGIDLGQQGGVGEHKVLVISVLGDKPDDTPEAPKPADAAPSPSKTSKTVAFKSSIPKKYSEPGASPLTRKVVSGANTIDLELTD